MIKGELQAQQQMAKLYQSSRTNVVEHLKHIYDEGELDENSYLGYRTAQRSVFEENCIVDNEFRNVGKLVETGKKKI